MAANIGPKIGIDGEAEYRKELNAIIQQQRTLASEMKAVTSAFDANDKSQEKLTAQSRVLSQQIDVQAERIKLLEKGVQASAEKFGENSKQTLKWKEALNDASSDLNGMKQSLGTVKTQLEAYSDESVQAAQKALESAQAQAQFEEQLSTVSQRAKTLNSELKAIGGSYDETTDKTAKLKAEQQNLTEQIENQNEYIKLLEKGLRNAADEFGEGSKEALKWRERLNDATVELKNMDDKLDQVKSGVDAAGDSMKDAGKSAVKLGDLIKGNVISQAIIGGVKNLANAFVSIGKAAFGFVSNAVQVAQATKAMNAQYTQTFQAVQGLADGALRRVSEETGIYGNRLKESASSIYAFAMANKATEEEGLDLMERGLRVAADSAAYYDKTLEESAETLQSFLKGNYANDAALGVSATEFTRNAAAAELFGKKFNDLSEIQKQQTLLKMVEDAQALSGAVGQAARESGEWTNQVGNLKSKWEEFLEKVGTPVLEGLLPLLEWAGGRLSDIVEKTDWNAFNQGVQDTFGKIEEYLSAIEWDEVIQGAGDIMTAIAENAPDAVEAIGKIAEGIKTIAEVPEKISQWFNQREANIFGVTPELMAEINTQSEQQFTKAQEQAGTFISGMTSLFSLYWGQMTGQSELSGEAQKASAANTQAAVSRSYNQMADEAIGATGRMADGNERNTERVGGALTEGVGRSAISVSKDTEKAATDIQKDVTEIADTTEDESKRASDGAKESAKAGTDGVLSETDRLATGLSEIAGEAYTWGNDLGINFAQGIRDAIPEIAAASSAAAQASADYLHHSTPDKGPMANDDTWAPDFMRQFAAGIRQNIPAVVAAVNQSAREIKLAMPATQAQMRATMTVPQTTMSYGDMYVTIDAKNIKEINDVVKVFQRHEAVVRQGYRR